MESLTPIIKYAVTSVYLAVFLVLSLFGLHRLYLAQLFRKHGSRAPIARSRFSRLPRVTVQLPIYNEQYVVSRLIEAVCALDYPRELLEIQVLDDSTDSTSAIASREVERLRKDGHDIVFIHRENRRGFKAGALEEGLERSKGEFIAIFDADFIPPADFLKRTIDHFTDPGVGMVQARWGHLNREYSTLTRIQSILLDGHFIIEQTARYAGGLFFNFNGTGGILRRECIESAGGWQHDTLTEDLDLSYRAQLRGWRFIFLKDLVAPAEVPVDINAFKAQQHRWTKGSVQTAKKLLPGLLASKAIGTRVKIEAAFHLLGGFSYVLLMALLILMLPFAYVWRDLGIESVVLLNLVAVTSGMLSLFRFYSLGIKETYGDRWLGQLKYLPLVIGLGSGLAVNNSRAVFEAVLGKRSDFIRTPKFAVIKKGEGWKAKSYVTTMSKSIFFELFCGLFFMALTAYSLARGNVSWVPFLLILQTGFLYSSILSIKHGVNKLGT